RRLHPRQELARDGGDAARRDARRPSADLRNLAERADPPAKRPRPGEARPARRPCCRRWRSDPRRVGGRACPARHQGRKSDSKRRPLMPRAFTRAVSPRIAECQLTHLERVPIDPARAVSQHAAYERALADAGLQLVRLPDLSDDPDAVFVEDTALLLDGHAVITRP